jgi:hypothetical protein
MPKCALLTADCLQILQLVNVGLLVVVLVMPPPDLKLAVLNGTGGLA